MLKHVAVIIIAFIQCIYLVGCNSNPLNKKNEIKQLKVALLNTYRKVINPSLPQITFKVYGEKAEGEGFGANRIKIYKNTKKHGLIQEIRFHKSFAYDHMSFNGKPLGIIFEDINFDGYIDIMIEKELPSHANRAYYYWLWDKKTSKYIRNYKLERVMSPTIDKQNNLIISNVSDTTEHSEIKYKFINNKLVLDEKVNHKVDIKNKVWHVTVKKKINSKMKIIKSYDERLE